MKCVLLTTSHPAPYIDRWLTEIEKKYETIVIYNHMSNDKKTWKDFSGHKGFCFETLTYGEIWKLVKQSDLIISGGWANRFCMAVILMGKIAKKKVSIFTDYPFHQKIIADLYKRVFLYRIIDYVLCATYSTCVYVKDKYKLSQEKIIFFPYAVDFSSTEYLEKERVTSTDSVDILIANNFIERKGYAILFKAFEKLNGKLPNNYIFHIAGQGNLLEKYQRIAEQFDLDIRFYGWIENIDYLKLQENCQIYIHASLEEPFGIPPLDAMVRGKVVIVSDGVKSTNTIIKHGVNGFIYPAYDADLLADIIQNLDINDLDSIRMNARKDARKFYGLEHILTAIDKCLP